MNIFQALYFLVNIHSSSDKPARNFELKVQRVSVGSLKRIMEFLSRNFPSKRLFGHVEFRFANPVDNFFVPNVCVFFIGVRILEWKWEFPKVNLSSKDCLEFGNAVLKKLPKNFFAIVSKKVLNGKPVCFRKLIFPHYNPVVT